MIFEASTIFCLVAGALVAAVLFFLCSYRTAGVLQQENYKGSAYLKWYYAKGNMQNRRMGLLSISLLLGIAVFNLCFSFLSAKGANAVAVLPFAGLCLLYVYADKKYALKVPLRHTRRAVRLGVCYFLVLVLFCTGLGFGMTATDYAVGKGWMTLLRYVPFGLVPLFFPLLLAAANAIAKIYETPVNRRFIRKAKGALAESGCIRIGVTGSFGKTSVKNFAAAILSVRYRVRVTPASFNTPIGIALDVNREGLDCDVYLAEMGARKRGDISELCDMVCPDYGIVTGVCPQHLETFGSLEAIAEEKGVLARRAKKGCVLGASAQGHIPEGALCEGKDFAAEEIVCTADGTDFVLRLPEGKIPVHTQLLGRHAAQDIALAAALASLLGMSAEEIGEGIGKIVPVPHRLQKICANGRFILDDSYNSNVEGAANAVETLRLFGGKKFVVTPGLVELGMLEEAENEKLGAALVGLDEIILVGETLVLAVRTGYLAAGGDAERIRVVPTLQKAQDILAEELSEGDCVLFLNDLPDKYL